MDKTQAPACPQAPARLPETSPPESALPEAVPIEEDDKTVVVGPHEYDPITRWDFRKDGRCELCHCPKRLHPVTTWVERRVPGDLCPPSVHTPTDIHTHLPDLGPDLVVIAILGTILMALVLAVVILRMGVG